MKILLVEKFLQEGGKSGGTTRLALEIQKILTQKGHEVIPFTTWNDEIREASPAWISKYKKYFPKYEDFADFGFNLSSFKKAWKMIYNREAAMKTEKLIQDEKPDIAYVHNIFHHIGPSILPVLKKYNIPVIQTFHDSKHLSANYYLSQDGKIWEEDKGGKYWRYVTDKVIKNSRLAGWHEMIEMTIHHKIWKPFKKYVDVCTAPSKFLIQKSKEYKYPKEILLLPNFVDEKEYQPNYSHEPYILYYGRISKEKGIHTAVEAFAKANDKKTKFYIAGRGEYEKKLKDLVAKKGLENQVQFVGFKTGDDLKDLVAKAMLVIVPSITYENSPMTIYESMALATPVIGSRLGGTPELVNEVYDIAESSGFTFEPGNSDDLADKLKFVFHNQDVLPEMRKSARKFFEQNFTSEKYYENLRKIAREKLNINL